MLSKEKILNALKSLPEEISLEELFEKLIVLQKIEIGLKQAEEGKVLSEEQARARLGKWLK